MSANAHTAVMTDLEQRIQDGRQLSAPRPRIDRIMEDRFYGPGWISSERCSLRSP